MFTKQVSFSLNLFKILYQRILLQVFFFFINNVIISVSWSWSWSSSTYSFDFILLPILIRHHSRRILLIASNFWTELMNVSFCWLAYMNVFMCWSSQENFPHEFVITSPANHAFPMYMLILFSLDEILLLKNMNRSTNFRCHLVRRWHHLFRYLSDEDLMNVRRGPTGSIKRFKMSLLFFCFFQSNCVYLYKL